MNRAVATGVSSRIRKPLLTLKELVGTDDHAWMIRGRGNFFDDGGPWSRCRWRVFNFFVFG